VGVGDKIGAYLPAYWTKGPKTQDLTFRHLLTHMSGFHYSGSDSDYGFMKSKYATGVAAKFGQYKYHNMNFGLCRILIPILAGTIDKQANFGSLNDAIWDMLTTSQFREYCNANVFGPAGVSTVGFAPSGTRALAYRQPHQSVAGWNSGDLATVSGGAGFRMSINEVLDVMGTFRRSGSILSTTAAQTFLDGFLGIDQRIETPAGNLYNKNGAWADADVNPRMEQCVAYFLPQDMELVCFVNSPLAGGKSLRGVVADTYVEHLK
jgi:CubicO group peptidase (beta-lactamase class C family)